MASRVVPTTKGTIIISFDISSAAHNDQDRFKTRGIVELDVNLLQ